MKTVIKKSLLIISIALTLCIFQINPKAIEIKSASTYNINTSIINQNDSYNMPDAIFISPIFLSADIQITDSEWYSAIFYYEAVKLDQGDFLAHYYIMNNGEAVQGNSKGDEQRMIIGSEEYKPIIINYLAKKDQTDFSIESYNTTKELILNIANNNNIKLENVFIKNIDFILKSNEPVKQQFGTLGGTREISLKKMIGEISPRFQPIKKNYTLLAEKIELPQGEIEYGQDVTMGLTIKNTSGKALYQGTDYEPLIAKTSNDPSKFFYNDIWLSQTQAGVMAEGDILKPGESKRFEIKLKIPLYFGLQTEEFQLINPLGIAYEGTKFNISLNIKHPDKEVVEITKTETGQLNVREGPWYSSAVTSRVTPGQRFFVLERTDTGYVKLDLGNGKSGWVLSKYTKII